MGLRRDFGFTTDIRRCRCVGSRNVAVREGVCGELPLVKRVLLVAVLVCVLAPDADAGIFRRRRGGGIRGLLAEARSTMAMADATMAKAQRLLKSPEFQRTMAALKETDPKQARATLELQREVLTATERVLTLQVKLKQLEADERKEKAAAKAEKETP